MKVFIAGATGVLGRALIRQFRARSHEVVGLARSDEGMRTIHALGAIPARADLFNADALSNVAQGCEVIIHAATAIPVKSYISYKDWEMNDRIRRDGTRALTICAGNVGAKTYLQQSVIWVARPSNGASFDEDSPCNPHSMLQSALDGEKIAKQAGVKFGFVAGVLRCGWFYSAEAKHTRMFAEQLRMRHLPVVGQGDAPLALLHVEDAASAFVAVAEKPRNGLWHVVDDELVSSHDLFHEFARSLHAPPPWRVPVWLARLAAGRDAVELITVPTRTTNRRFRNNFPWTPQYPGFREGLAQMVSAWRREGFFNK